MELLSGDLHSKIVRSAGGLVPEDATKILSHIVSGMRYLHETHQMIHRDIKPANVFLTSGVAKIGDFGLCISKEELENQPGPCGTPHYLPADVWLEMVPPSERNDIWGAGCTLKL